MLIGRKLRSFVFPRDIACALCGEELAKEERAFCQSCSASIRWKCIRRDLPALDAVFSAAEYAGPIRELILRYKYKNNRHLAHAFALEMADFPREEASLLLPVPIHPVRRRERGFCQTTELCRELALRTGLPLAPRGIKRLRNTSSQTQLDGAARLLNIKDAFAADSARVGGRNCILVDDVVSTGATLSECASALRAAGAASVTGWAIAT